MARRMHFASTRRLSFNLMRKDRTEGKGMNKIKQTVCVALVVALSSITMLAQAQDQRVYRMNDRAMQELIQRIETGADRFRADLASALDQSRLDNTQREDNI